MSRTINEYNVGYISNWSLVLKVCSRFCRVSRQVAKVDGRMPTHYVDAVKMTCNNASGGDDIPAEVYKHGGIQP